jgi:hypothetical protein
MAMPILRAVPDPPDQAESTRDVAARALKKRVALEEKAERARIRADEARKILFEAEAEAERTRIAAEAAEQERLAAEEEAGRARAGADDALATWAGTLMSEPIPQHEVRASALAVEAVAEPTCQIAIWRGYLSSRFYARMLDAHGSEIAVAESPPFRAKGKPLPEQTQEAVTARDALVAQLGADGWEPVGGDGTWFGGTFRRRV